MMDIISILNLDDVPAYRPSSPQSVSSHGLDTPPTPSESSPVLSYGTHSPVAIEDEVGRRLRYSSRESTASPDRWPSHFTALDSRHSKPDVRRVSVEDQLAAYKIAEVQSSQPRVSGLSSPSRPPHMIHPQLSIHGQQKADTRGYSPMFAVEKSHLPEDFPIQSSRARHISSHIFPPSQSPPSTVPPPLTVSTPLHSTRFSRSSMESTQPSTDMTVTPVRLPGFQEIFQQSMASYHNDMSQQMSQQVTQPLSHQQVIPLSPLISAPPTISPSEGRVKEQDYDSDATISESVGDQDVSPIENKDSLKCGFQENCQLDSPVRPVISHYFGRNKRETRAIPKTIWINYCRQHYQRSKYRLDPAKYAQRQMDLVRSTVRRLERWDGVSSFEIRLRKRIQGDIAREDRTAAAAVKAGGPVPLSQVKERWMIPFCGKGKTFLEVYNIIDAVSAHCDTNTAQSPEFEIVPGIKPSFLQGSNQKLIQRAQQNNSTPSIARRTSKRGSSKLSTSPSGQSKRARR